MRTIVFAKGLPSSERTIPAVKTHVIGMFAIREGKGGLFELLITTVMFLITLVTMTISIVFLHVYSNSHYACLRSRSSILTD